MNEVFPVFRAASRLLRLRSMFPARVVLLCLLAGALRCGAKDASVEGQVELPKGHNAPVVTRRYEVVTTGGVVSTDPPLAVVYLEGAPFHTGPAATRQVAQKNLAFVPTLLPIQVGTRVEFPNQDDTYHNIFSYSPAKRFDLGRYRRDEKPVPAQVFDKAGLVTLRCDIHEHMRGLVLVLNTPYFTITDPQGRFRLHGLPAGNYTLKAWVDSQTTREHPVTLQDGAIAHVDFP